MKNSGSFPFSAQNIDCGYLLELPCEAVLTITNNLYFEQNSENYQNLCFWAEIRNLMFIPVNFSFTVWKWGLRG